MTIDEARAQFPVLERFAYLNAGTNGPLARPTVDAMVAQEQADLELGRGGPEYFARALELREQVRARLAAAVGVAEANLALATSTTNGCNIVLAGLELGAEDEIVTTDGEHFGLLGALAASPALVRVAAVRELPPEQALEALLAEVTPRTRLLAVSHVCWMSGNGLPVEELKEATGLPVLVELHPEPVGPVVDVLPVHAGRERGLLQLLPDGLRLERLDPVRPHEPAGVDEAGELVAGEEGPLQRGIAREAEVRAVREDALDHLLGVALLAQDRCPLLRMLVQRGVDFVVEVVQERGHPPELLVLSETLCVRAHGGLDRECVAQQRLALGVAVEGLPGALSGRLHGDARIAPSHGANRRH